MEENTKATVPATPLDVSNDTETITFTQAEKVRLYMLDDLDPDKLKFLNAIANTAIQHKRIVTADENSNEDRALAREISVQLKSMVRNPFERRTDTREISSVKLPTLEQLGPANAVPEETSQVMANLEFDIKTSGTKVAE